MEMGQLVRIRIGKWNKSAAGCWQFEGDPGIVEQYIVARTNKNIDSFTSLIREELVIGPECPVALTYQLPDGMLHGIQSTSQPSNIVTSDDVVVVMSVQEWTNVVQLCITYGARNVAKYQFLCRSPFNIGDVKYLDGSVTEEEHFASLRGLVAGDIIRCSDTLLKHLFSEEKLVLIYHFSYEIEMARGFPLCETNDDEPIADNADDGSRYFNSGLPEGEIGPNYWENANNGLSETVNGEEPVNCVSLSETVNGEEPVNCSTGYIRQAVEGGTQYNPIHVTVAENSDEGTKEDDDASKVNEKRQTGGVEGVHDSYIHVTDDSDNRHVATPMGSDRVIINDSSSDIVSYQGPGEGNNNPDVVFVGMIFKCREDFKHHMAMYAIRSKFRFQNIRSASGGMVLRCFSHTCSWRVYAAILKNTQLDGSESHVSLYPPASRRPPGRPRKNMILSRGKFEMQGKKKRTMCSRFKEVVDSDDEGVWKNGRMSRFVHVMNGQWRKSQEGVWRFDHYSALQAHDILVGRTYHVEAIKGMASCRNSSPTNLPTATMDARTGWSYNPPPPPTQNILTTAEVEMMICVHEWNTEPRLCVIFGAEEVATYQFRCRSPFTIGRRHFLGDGVTEEQHMAAVLGIYFLYFAWNHTAFIRTRKRVDMIRGNEFLYSQSVMAEIFNEDEMVLLYRFSLEIEKAKNSLDLNLGPTVESGDHIVPSVGRTWIVNRVDRDRARMNTANGYGEKNAENIEHAHGDEGNNGGDEGEA
ncbi:hypothetical protein HID58_043580 [Brassica napus]|uniref:Transposase MuDR plant domain-containing protein n=1 Tax=Brassica napus TaxID=3708 RepID=A0ABQ8BGW6_BRANA|nr:hypothetical protein HID58_043580 [Brassica napus]